MASITRFLASRAALASTPLYSGDVQKPRKTAHCTRKCRRNAGSLSCRCSRGAAVRYFVPASRPSTFAPDGTEAPAATATRPDDVLSSRCVSVVQHRPEDVEKAPHPAAGSSAAGLEKNPGAPERFVEGAVHDDPFRLAVASAVFASPVAFWSSSSVVFPAL